MIRVYNDTNLIGENAEQDQDEYLALKQLRELTNQNGSTKVIIETISNRNLNELDQTKDEKLRHRLQQAAKVLSKESNDHKLVGIHTFFDRFGTCINSPFVVDVPDEEIFAKLMGIPLEDEMDARLLTVAIFNKYDVFLTRDWKSILKKRQEINALFPEIRLMKPSELLAHLHTP